MADVRDIEKLLFLMNKTNATDLHLKVGSSPILRVDRQVRRIESPPLSGEQIERLVAALMPPRAREDFERTGSADFAYSIPGVGRFRVNVYKQRGSTSMAARRVRYDIPTIESLNLPTGVTKLTTYEQGFCIVAGSTGSGKSTTLAALLNEINHTRRCHILTIEDPIEYLYRDDKAFVNQREVGMDTDDFQSGLRDALRADPGVILVGEMRDAETFEIALSATETGHLVFGTLHAASAAQSISRALELFPEPRHHQLRQLIAFNLRAVVVQMLLKGAAERARVVPACEVMLVNPSIRKLIREDHDAQIGDVIRGARGEGMQDITQSLYDLVKAKLVSDRTALEAAPNPEALAMLLRGIVVGGAQGGILR